MKDTITDLIEAIKKDYATYTECDSEIRRRMIEEFNEKITYTVGKKYVKIITGSSVWGFIVNQDDGKFRKGDILKAASWAAPAKNCARGNIINGGYEILWTGPKYLR